MFVKKTSLLGVQDGIALGQSERTPILCYSCNRFRAALAQWQLESRKVCRSHFSRQARRLQ